jgi:hypothetical protein
MGKKVLRRYMDPSDRNQHYVGESYIMRGLMVCTPYPIYYQYIVFFGR